MNYFVEPQGAVAWMAAALFVTWASWELSHVIARFLVERIAHKEFRHG